jgi:hypoxanthine phosphoribosyltransferase
LYSARDVARALDRMATELIPRLRSSNPVVLAVMHGGAFAALELSKRFEFPHEFDYVHVTRYRGATRGREIAWRVRPSKALAGRTVLVVDDILDHGKTLRALEAELDRVGVKERLSAVLVVKELTRKRARPSVAVSGLTVGDVYVFGSGMDFHGYWRGLRGIYAVAESGA